jgi:hypothetical protein
MQHIIQQLENIITEYTPQLQRISPDDLIYKASPVKWSNKEVLGHLIDSAQNNIRRFVVAQYEDKPYIVYAQDTWVAAADYQHYPEKDLLDLWVLLNRHIVILWKNLPAAAENNEVQTQEIHTIKWLAEDYNKHLLHHLHTMLKLEEVPYP